MLKEQKQLFLFALILFCNFFGFLSGQETKLEFNPILNIPYNYEAEYLVSQNEDDDIYNDGIQMLMKVDFDVTYINQHDCYLEFKGVKGFKKSSYSSYSTSSNKKYFNSYDTLNEDNLTKAFNKLFPGKKFLFSTKNGVRLVGDTTPGNLKKILEDKKFTALLLQIQRNYPNLLGDFEMREGYSWNITDTVMIKPDKFLKMQNNYVIKSITRDALNITATGQGSFRSNDIFVADRLLLKRETGMLQAASQYMQPGKGSEVYSLVRMKGVDVPDVTEEYEIMQGIKRLNYISTKQTSKKEALPEALPMKKLSDRELNQFVDRYLDSLSLNTDPKNSSLMFLYSFQYAKQTLGMYIKTGALNVFTKQGDTLALPLFLGKFNEYYCSPLLVGPFCYNMYTPRPEVKDCSVDLTVFIPTKTEEIVLTPKKNSWKQFELSMNDSTMTLVYHYDRKKNYGLLPFRSMKCYDKDNKEIPVFFTGRMFNQKQKHPELYSPEELADLNANLNFIKKDKEFITYFFSVKNAARVVLETFTGEKAFNRKLYRTIE